MSFPRFARDVEYFDMTLGAELERRFNIDRARLRAAHEQECNPAFITAKKSL